MTEALASEPAEQGPAWMRGEALSHLHETLVETGAPLEALIANDCRRFATVYGDATVVVDSGRVVYGGQDGVTPLREVDRCVTFYEEFEVGERIGIQLNLQVVIEVKHRAGLHAFGFSADDSEDVSTPIVVAGEFAHSDVLRRVARRPVGGLPTGTSEIALIVERNGSPKRFDEQLIYKSSSSALDFVRADLPAMSVDQVQVALDAIGILSHVVGHVEASRFEPLYAARDWARKNLREHASAFAMAFQGSGTVYHLVDMYCPTVCLNAPLWTVDVTHDGEIGEIRSVDQLLAGVRVAGWPHDVRRAAPMVGPQATVVVTNRLGLHRLLPALFEWFIDAGDAMRTRTTAEAEELLIDAAFSSFAQHKWGRDAVLYRSDLDMTNSFRPGDR